MKILISGASGLIGTGLKHYLQDQGHTVYTLARGQHSGLFFWNPKEQQIHMDPNTELDAVINLNGVNIGDARWSDKRKEDIINSRVSSTQLLATTLSQLVTPPKVLINASAIGYYGETGSTSVDEDSNPGNNFLSDIVTQWEASAQAAIDAGIRTVFIRSGVVLDKEQGALAKMLLPFKLGLGGPVGSGKQFMSWISLRDEIRAIDFLLQRDDISGPINLTAPEAVSNYDFTKALGKALKRPTLFPMPEFMVKILFGEMGEMLLLGSARVAPKRLLELGFEFKDNNVEEAFAHCLK